jgi:hypothetical protein
MSVLIHMRTLSKVRSTPLFPRKQTVRAALEDPSGKTQSESARSIIGLMCRGTPAFDDKHQAGYMSVAVTP